MTSNRDIVARLPLIARHALDGGKRHGWILESADGRPLTGSDHVFMTEDEARFIVHRVNAYPQLVAQCENLLEWFTLFRDDLIVDHYGDDAIDHIIAGLSTALGGPDVTH